MVYLVIYLEYSFFLSIITAVGYIGHYYKEPVLLDGPLKSNLVSVLGSINCTKALFLPRGPPGNVPVLRVMHNGKPNAYQLKK